MPDDEDVAEGSGSEVDGAGFGENIFSRDEGGRTAQQASKGLEGEVADAIYRSMESVETTVSTSHVHTMATVWPIEAIRSPRNRESPTKGNDVYCGYEGGHRYVPAPIESDMIYKERI